MNYYSLFCHLLYFYEKRKMDFSIKLQSGMILRGMINSPGTDIRAMVILVHGLGDHTGRFTSWVDKFSEEGIGVTGLDLPGHGKSDGRRGVIRNYNQTDEMLDLLLKEYVKTFPGVPVFIYGHSLGGGIVLKYILGRNPEISGAIITSPWLRLPFEPGKYKVMLAKVMSVIFPGFVQPSGLITDHISRDKDIVEAYRMDPLVHDKISAGLFASAVSAASYISNNIRLLKVPVLLMHGSDDLITSPDASIELASESDLIDLKIWDGGYHELHNEPFREDVFVYIINWIRGHI